MKRKIDLTYIKSSESEYPSSLEQNEVVERCDNIFTVMDIIWTVNPDKFICHVEDDDKRELLIQVTQEKSSMISGHSHALHE